MPSDVHRAVTATAPGRVNLIGGHVDFHEGIVVPMAIDRCVTVRLDPRHDRQLVIDSDLDGGTLRSDLDRPAGLDREESAGSRESAASRETVPSRWGGREPGWARLARAVVDDVASAATLGGASVSIRSTLPAGGGLSSSAAFEVALAGALIAASGGEIDLIRLARRCQAVELAATGVECGIQDQLAVALGGLFELDCREVGSDPDPSEAGGLFEPGCRETAATGVRPVSLPDGCGVVIVDSGVRRTLAGSGWGELRAESFRDAAAIGVRVLRDAGPAQVADRPRARHVVDEIARASAFAAAARRGDAVECGRLMLDSHRSSRDLWGSSVPELDRLVETLMDAGAFGARLTGGGFGGWVVGLVPAGFDAAAVGGLEARPSPGLTVRRA